jgi:hypothetical protein
MTADDAEEVINYSENMAGDMHAVEFCGIA